MVLVATYALPGKSTVIVGAAVPLLGTTTLKIAPTPFPDVVTPLT